MPHKPKTKPASVFGSKPGQQGESYTIWRDIDEAILRALVVAVSSAGGTVQLGTTQNGTAATLRIYHGGEGQNFYAGSVEAMEDLFQYWTGVFEEYTGSD